MSVSPLFPNATDAPTASAETADTTARMTLEKLLRFDELLNGYAKRHPALAEQRAGRAERQRAALKLDPPFLVKP